MSVNSQQRKFVIVLLIIILGFGAFSFFAGWYCAKQSSKGMYHLNMQKRPDVKFPIHPEVDTVTLDSIYVNWYGNTPMIDSAH